MARMSAIGLKRTSATALHMSAIGPKRTSVVAPHMSAFGGKADMTGYGCLLSRSLLGVKRTWLIAAHMSASDPKRTYLSATSHFDKLCATGVVGGAAACAGEISSKLLLVRQSHGHCRRRARNASR